MNSFLKMKINNFKIIVIYYLTIILLTSYATYKNGIILYQKHLIDFVGIFKPLLLVLISIAIPIITNYIYKNSIRKEKYSIKEDYTPILFALITLSLPLNISIIIFLVLILIFSILKLFYNYDKINYYSIIKLIIVLCLVLVGKYGYETIYDISIETNFSTFDLFLGRGIGGIGTSNILLLLICFLIMLLNKAYKNEIPIISFVLYILTLCIVDLFLNNSIIFDIKELIKSEFIYGIIFIATISFYSPIKYKEKNIYAIIIGILSFIFNKILNIYEGVFIAILIADIIIICYEKIEGIVLNEHKRI